MKICPQDQCTGCSACISSCNHGAIRMILGSNGHFFPEVNDNICVGCNLCIKSCPNNVEPIYHQNIEAYIATAVNKIEAQHSTSAGIASVLARYVIRVGGIVYGCSGVDCTHVCHIRISSEAELTSIKGSKYVQSSLDGIFHKVKKDLKSGIRVLFIGTPCQVAGLLAYLRQPYDLLFTIDLVCHGVPSQQILIDALHAYLPNENLSKINLKFRIKESGKSKYGLFAFDSLDKKILHSEFPENEFITGFLNGLFYRESCFNCHYTRPDRVSDITLGDFWDHEHQIEINNSNGGLSMVCVNTNKGKELVENCSSLLNLISHEYSDFVSRNGQLSWSIKRHKHYDTFFMDNQKLGFVVAASKSLKEDIVRIKRNLLLSRLSSYIYKIPGAKWFYKRIIKFK